MRPAEGSEDATVASILAHLDPTANLTVGPGHDCAAVRVGADEVVVTTDVLVDGVHFEVATCGPRAAAEKALLVNLSDLAAAAAEPLAFEVGVVLPRQAPASWVEGLAQGFAAAGSAWGCPCAGGDTNVGDGPLVLAVTALGRPGPMGVVTRAGARVGDALSVTGPLGGSLAGRHLHVVPRLAEARVLAELGIPHAMMDLSDGLAADLPRLCRASEVGALLEVDLLPIHPDVRLGPGPRDDTRHALEDGEDFELLLAHAPIPESVSVALAARGVHLHRIGTVQAESAGLCLRTKAGEERPLTAGGYDHFRHRP